MGFCFRHEGCVFFYWGGGEEEEGVKPKKQKVPWRIAGFVSIVRQVGSNVA